jgi:DNA-binding NarL/FixJ family response regulator
MNRIGNDWIGLVEAAYHLDGSDDDWLQGVLDRAASVTMRGFWPTIATYRYSARFLEVERSATLGPEQASRILRASLSVDVPIVRRFFRTGPAVTSLSQALYAHEPALADVVQQLSDGVVHDKLAVKGFTGQGDAVMICWLFGDRVVPSRGEAHRCQCAASHMGAGLRLRRLAGRLTPNAPVVEAVLGGDGAVHDARHDAQRAEARDALREAVRAVDRIRTREGRRDPDAALVAWEGLVRGRWSLVDHFDADGRRHVLAVRNDPRHPDPRGLTDRERQVAEFVGQGHAGKAIAHMLGISRSAVANATARAARKLGLSSLAELAAFFAPTGLRTTLAETAVEGDRLLVGAFSAVREDLIEQLTDAERAVLAALLAGSTNADIARRRECSERTVANQVQAIFRKLGVRSRAELAVRLHGGRAD